MSDEIGKVLTDDDRRAKLRQFFTLLEEMDRALPIEDFQSESLAIESATEALKDGFQKDFLSTCEGCSKIVLAGDQGHRCMDGEVLCQACTPSWDDVKEQWMDGYAEGKDSDADAFMRRYNAHLASGGQGTDLMLYTL